MRHHYNYRAYTQNPHWGYQQYFGVIYPKTYIGRHRNSY